MTGYEFHAEAQTDLDEIWEHIAAGNSNAADRLMADIRQTLDNLVPFPQQGHRRPDPPVARCVSSGCGIT